MDENKEFIPSLTLDPNAASAASAVQLPEEPAAPVLEEKRKSPLKSSNLNASPPQSRPR